MLLIIACLVLRPILTASQREAVKDINSLADAIREVSGALLSWVLKPTDPLL